VANIERWHLLRFTHREPHTVLVRLTIDDELQPVPDGWESIEVVRAEQLREAVEALEGIAAIVDEPLDERHGHGPTRQDQFRKIEDAVRRWRGQ
jgi:hypothetical protein